MQTLPVLSPLIVAIGLPAADVAWEKRVLSDQYYCDGISTGDFNHDGRPDIVAGPFWYEGPDFKSAHAFQPPQVFPTEPSPTDSMFSYVWDFNGDGWDDILVLGRVHLHQAFWYENPRGEDGLWRKHFAFHRVQGESPPFLDVDGDGRPELVAHWQDRWGLIQPDWQAPTNEWSFKPITPRGSWHHFYHGEGIGDVNGDGRLDLILNEGWWEQPADRSRQEWTAHPFVFSDDKGGAQMFATDVDGDGDNDVITALNAHGWGLAWFEQLRTGGEITFRRHLIMGTRAEESRYGVAFSQPHALAIGDVNDDGLPDIITGKRRWAHGPTGDVEPMAAPVNYWFELRRDDGTATFHPHLIDDNSGLGVQITVADVNADGRLDVLTSSKLGAFAFLNQAVR
ncbi:MAG TPA: cysteine protease [Verrucomicrobiales bacterium]|nr:cysteine protease [Verrucomicrobiales bacterium]